MYFLVYTISPQLTDDLVIQLVELGLITWFAQVNISPRFYYSCPRTSCVSAQEEQWVGTVILNGCEVIERPSKKEGFCFKIYHPLQNYIWATKVRTQNEKRSSKQVQQTASASPFFTPLNNVVVRFIVISIDSNENQNIQTRMTKLS